MKELLFILADAAPIDFIITQLKKHIAAYEESPTEDNFTMLAAHCVMIITKKEISQNTDGVDGLLKEMQSLENLMKLRDIKNQ